VERARCGSDTVLRMARHENGRREPTKRKPVYLNGAPIGSARTWHEAAMLISEIVGRSLTATEAIKCGSEGPDGFHVTMPQR